MTAPLIIAGPCSAETREQTLATARALAETGLVNMLRAGVWKPRTRPGQFEGAGLKALQWLLEARQLTGLPVATEVATAKHVESALEMGIDMLWIGARTTGNPFSVQEIADALRGTGVPIWVKNPTSPDIDLWAGAVARLAKAGAAQIGLIHRGFAHYAPGAYRNDPMWHLAIEMRARLPELRMICDPSHICGNREGLREVAQKAADLRFDGLIVESHIDPAAALSDAAQQLTPADLAAMLRSIRWRAPSTDNPEYVDALEKLRGQIDRIDDELLALLARRMGLAEQIGQVKKANDVAILQGGRWQSIVEKAVAQASKLGLSEEFLRTILEAIHIESIDRQNAVMNEP